MSELQWSQGQVTYCPNCGDDDLETVKDITTCKACESVFQVSYKIVEEEKEEEKVMKTMNEKKAKRLINGLPQLGEKFMSLKDGFKNPEFVNEENAQEQFDITMAQWKALEKSLENARNAIVSIYEELGAVEND